MMGAETEGSSQELTDESLVNKKVFINNRAFPPTCYEMELKEATCLCNAHTQTHTHTCVHTLQILQGGGGSRRPLLAR